MSDFNPREDAEALVNEYLELNGWPGSVRKLVDNLDRSITEFADAQCIYYGVCEEIVNEYAKQYGQYADDALAGTTFKWDEQNEANQAAAYYIVMAALQDEAEQYGKEVEEQIDDVVGDMNNTEWCEEYIDETDVALYGDMPFNPFTEGTRNLADDVQEEYGVYKWDDPIGDNRKLMAELDCGLWLLHVCDVPYHELEDE
jgi:hypothetical protein